VLASLQIADRFEAVYLSWRIGAAKPDGKIFMHALQGMNVPPPLALHVGDSIEEDIEGALGVGMPAALLDRNDRHTGWKRSPRLRSLSDLVEMLC
jgi:putative hydrolase of the HAD superfamily